MRIQKKAMRLCVRACVLYIIVFAESDFQDVRYVNNDLSLGNTPHMKYSSEPTGINKQHQQQRQAKQSS